MDLRVEKTYKALVDAFTDLFEEMPMEDVSVAQLCERAMVRRTTFYRHFADKDEFVRFYVLSLRDEIEQRALKDEEGVPVRDYVISLARELGAFCLEHERMVANALGGTAFGTFFTMASDVVQRTLLLRLQGEQERGAVFDAPVERLATFIAGGTIQALLSWWYDGHAANADLAAGLDVILDRLLV